MGSLVQDLVMTMALSAAGLIGEQLFNRRNAVSDHIKCDNLFCAFRTDLDPDCVFLTSPAQNRHSAIDDYMQFIPALQCISRFAEGGALTSQSAALLPQIKD